jgi:hypothetical protein
MSTKQLIIALSIAVPILLLQSTWMFINARKRKEKKYWLWGLFGLIHCPGSLIVYLIVTRVIMDRSKSN